MASIPIDSRDRSKKLGNQSFETITGLPALFNERLTIRVCRIAEQTYDVDSLKTMSNGNYWILDLQSKEAWYFDGAWVLIPNTTVLSLPGDVLLADAVSLKLYIKTSSGVIRRLETSRL